MHKQTESQRTYKVTKDDGNKRNLLKQKHKALRKFTKIQT